jgi:hypothetical protein
MHKLAMSFFVARFHVAVYRKKRHLMRVNYIEALKAAAKRLPKPPPDAIEQLVRRVEKIRSEVKSRANRV